jgi:two-component system, NarL family, nitrate/nitrite response regulator NarL
MRPLGKRGTIRIMSAKTVLILDDHPLVADSVAAIVRSILIDVHIEIFHSLKTAQNYLAKGILPTVIVTDLSLPDSKGIGTVEQIINKVSVSTDKSAQLPLIVFSGIEHSILKHQCLALGVLAFITKSDDGKALRAILEKSLKSSPSSPLYPSKDRSNGSSDLLSQSLTRRQTQIWQDLAAGYSNAEIATRHGVGINTVKTHVKDVFDRIGARNRTEAAKLYFSSQKPMETSK